MPLHTPSFLQPPFVHSLSKLSQTLMPSAPFHSVTPLLLLLHITNPFLSHLKTLWPPSLNHSTTIITSLRGLKLSSPSLLCKCFLFSTSSPYNTHFNTEYLSLPSPIFQPNAKLLVSFIQTYLTLTQPENSTPVPLFPASQLRTK